MIKRLSILEGLAIIGVVLNHAAILDLEALFIRANQFLTNAHSTLNQIDSFSYYLLLVLRQLPIFAVPIFLFASGFFVAYSVRCSKQSLFTKSILKRIYVLLIPYTIWSIFIFGLDYLNGKTYSFFEYILIFISKGAIGPYWFMPVLFYLYLISLWVAPQVKNNSKVIILISGLVQIISVIYFYFYTYNINVPGVQAVGDFSLNLPILQVNFYFFIGIVAGYNLETIKNFLAPYKNFIPVALLFFAILNIVESNFLIHQLNSVYGIAFWGSFSFNFYSITVILFSITSDWLVKLKWISSIGNKCFGIFLVHYPIMLVFSKFISDRFPQLLYYQIPFVLLLIVMGLGIPLLLMFILTKFNFRNIYRYLFA